jgi:tetratricopeptide (TPR) repeat protein
MSPKRQSSASRRDYARQHGRDSSERALTSVRPLGCSPSRKPTICCVTDLRDVAHRLSGYRQVLGGRRESAISAGAAISRAGDAVNFAALPLLAYVTTRSPASVATLVVHNTDAGLRIWAAVDARAAVDLLEARGDDPSFRAAKRALDAALAQGEDPKLLLDRGYIHQIRGTNELREAIRWYEGALELDPAFASAHYHLVGAFILLGQAHDVIDRYQRRIAEDPADLVAYRCLAQGYVAAGRWVDAAVTIEAGRRLAPEDVVLLDIERCLLAGTGRPDEALGAWQRALQLARFGTTFDSQCLVTLLYVQGPAPLLANGVRGPVPVLRTCETTPPRHRELGLSPFVARTA